MREKGKVSKRQREGVFVPKGNKGLPPVRGDRLGT